MVRVLGAISAPAFQRWREQRLPRDPRALEPVSVSSLASAALITVWRAGEKCHLQLSRSLPVPSSTIRECMYRAARTPGEHDAIARLDIAQGLTSFHVNLRDVGMQLRVHTRTIRLLHKKKSHHLAVWCTWPAAHGGKRRATQQEKEEEEDEEAPPYVFWCSSGMMMDVARFAHYQCALLLPPTAAAPMMVRYECDTAPCGGDDASLSWSRGTVTWGTPPDEEGVEFYRIG